jgi:hypothetical protein
VPMMTRVMKLSCITDVRVDENIGLLVLNCWRPSTEKRNLMHPLF